MEFVGDIAETLLTHPVVSAHQRLIRCLSPLAQYFSGFSRSKGGLSPIFIAVFRRLRKEEEEANNISGAESETMTAEKKMLFRQPTSLLTAP